jgi:5-methylthioadenosine/S-adenosylhomocysteine deaminase
MKTKIFGGTILAFDGEKHDIMQDAEVVFQGSHIIYVGRSYEGNVDRTVDAKSKLVLPGLINIHTHSLTSCLMHRGVLEDEGSTLYKYVLPIRYGTASRGPYATGQDAYRLSKLVILEALKSGVTTIFEQTDNLEDVIQIAKGMGLRLYGCRSYYSGMPFEENGEVLYPRFEEHCNGLDENLRLIKQYHDACDGRLKVWLGPHAPDTCSIDLLQETREKADQLKVGIGTHVAQTLTEVNQIRKRYQKTPVEFLNDIGFLREDVIAAHAIYTTASDVDIMSRSNMTVAHCPTTYLKQGLRAPMANYRKCGINMVIGTDENSMDLIEEMRLAMLSSKLIENDPYATRCLDVLNAVTLNAARALLRNDIGRISPGARADIILIDLQHPHVNPSRDPLKALLYHANRNDVGTVIVDGQILMADHKVLAIDEKKVVTEAKDVAERIWKRADSEIGLPKLLTNASN